jgi:hypothetical protein
MSQDVIQEYLVSLGFKVDKSQFAAFNESMNQVGKTVSKNVTGITADLFKLQFGITSGMLAIGSAAVVAADKFADFNTSMRLGAMHSFMTQKEFTKLNDALKVTGATLQDMTWDPILRKQGLQIMDDTGRMLDMLGAKGAFAAQGIADLKFEFGRFTHELDYLQKFVITDLFGKLFPGSDPLTKFRELNEYLISHLPEISAAINTVLVPALQDAWEILKEFVEMGREAWVTFQQIVGILTGDSGLDGTAITLGTISDTMHHLTSGALEFTHAMLDAEKVVAHLALALADIGTGHFGAAAAQIQDAFKSLTPGAGAVTGIAVGGGVGGTAGTIAGGALGAVAGGGIFDAFTIPLGAAIGGMLGSGAGAIGGGFAGHALGQGNPLADGGASFNLLDTIVHLESRGHQNGRDGKTLTSSAGALGIAQLMPATAKGLGVNPYDEKDNLRGAAMLLQQLNKHYNGNEAEVLAAYNFGSGNVDKQMLRNHGKFRLSDLPTETQNYVRNGEAYRGNSVDNAGDITVNGPLVTITGSTNMSHEQVATAVQHGIRQAKRKDGAFSAVSTSGPFQ